MAQHPEATALGDIAARQLANATKTTAQLPTITPRWLVHLLQWLPVEAGIYRLNTVKNPRDVRVACSQRDESELPQTYVDYDEAPREYFLNAVTTILDVHTRVSDLYSSPHDQIKEQLRLTIETIGGGTPRLVHSRPKAAIASGWVRKKAGSFQTLVSRSSRSSGVGAPVSVEMRWSSCTLASRP
jgi:hypothetical protein